MTKLSILVVDDETDILELLEYNLLKSNYIVYTADNGIDAIALIKEHRPDVVLLDIMMTGMDGLSVCTSIKDDPDLSDIPVIFLTARTDEKTEVTGLDLGADDFLTKPVSISKLKSRIQAVLRRYNKDPLAASKPLQVRGLVIDRSRFLVSVQGNEVHLPKKEFELLYLLASNPGKVLDRQTLLDLVWGSRIYVIDRTVDVHIRKIREKIGNGYIETIKGVGYRFKK